MPPVLPISYDSRDYESIIRDLLRAIPFKTPDWTDHNASDQGIVLLELLAFVADVLHYYIDRAAGEAFLATALRRSSVVNLLKLIDYELRGAVPSSVDVVFTLSQTYGTDVLIQAGTVLATSARRDEVAILFETTEDLVIPAGEVEGTVAVEQGETVEDPLQDSEGIPYQRFTLTKSPVVGGSVMLYWDEGAGDVLWDEVDSFERSRPGDRHFKTQRDENERVICILGDNVKGRIPVDGATARATYRIGGGAFGNVGARTITKVRSPIIHDAVAISVAVTNPTSASGGEDRQTIADARRMGPRTLRALYRAVTLPDFEALIEDFPGIAVASATEEPGESCGCCVAIRALPTGGGVMSSALRDDLMAFLKVVKMAGQCVFAEDGATVQVDIAAQVFIGANFERPVVVQAIADEHAAFFALDSPATGFGQPVFISDIYGLLGAVEGVQRVELLHLSRRPVPRLEVWAGSAVFDPQHDPISGAVAIGEDAVDEVWTLTWLTPTTYSVAGSLSGPQTARGTIGTVYVSDRSEVSFRIMPSVPGDPVAAPRQQDRATWRTSKKVATVPIDANEVPTAGALDLDPEGGAYVQPACA